MKCHVKCCRKSKGSHCSFDNFSLLLLRGLVWLQFCMLQSFHRVDSLPPVNPPVSEILSLKNVTKTWMHTNQRTNAIKTHKKAIRQPHALNIIHGTKIVVLMPFSLLLCFGGNYSLCFQDWIPKMHAVTFLRSARSLRIYHTAWSHVQYQCDQNILYHDHLRFQLVSLSWPAGKFKIGWNVSRTG